MDIRTDPPEAASVGALLKTVKTRVSCEGAMMWPQEASSYLLLFSGRVQEYDVPLLLVERVDPILVPFQAVPRPPHLLPMSLLHVPPLLHGYPRH